MLRAWIFLVLIFTSGLFGEKIYLSRNLEPVIFEELKFWNDRLTDEVDLEFYWFPLEGFIEEDSVIIAYDWEAIPESKAVLLSDKDSKWVIGRIHDYFSRTYEWDQLIPDSELGWERVPVLKSLDRGDSPFTSRTFSGVRFDEARAWVKRQKVNTWASHTHMHFRDIRPEHFEEYPHWFAKDENLKPMPPPYSKVNSFNDHPDLSELEVVERIVEKTIERVREKLKADESTNKNDPNKLLSNYAGLEIRENRVGAGIDYRWEKIRALSTKARIKRVRVSSESKISSLKPASLLALHPDTPISVSISANDSFEFGHFSDDYPYAPDSYFRGWQDWSNHVFNFSNEVTERVLELETWDSSLKSRARLGAYAYLTWENVPDFDVHPNILPMLTFDRAQWWDEEFKQSDLDLVPKWKEKETYSLGTFDYLCGMGYIFPRSLVTYTAESIQWLSTQGIDVYFNMANPLWAYDGHVNWLSAKLLENPDRNAKALLDAYFQSYYGPASGEAREFFDYSEKLWMNQTGTARWLRFYYDPWQAILYSAEDIQAMSAFLNQAMIKAEKSGEEKHIARIQLIADGWEVTRRFFKRIHSQFEMQYAETFEELLELMDNQPSRDEISNETAALVESSPLHINFRETGWIFRHDFGLGKLAELWLENPDDLRIENRLRKELSIPSEVIFNRENPSIILLDNADAIYKNPKFCKEKIFDTEGIKIEKVEGGLKLESVKFANWNAGRTVEPEKLTIGQLEIEGKWSPAAEIWIRIRYFDEDFNRIDRTSKVRLAPLEWKGLNQRSTVLTVPSFSPRDTYAMAFEILVKHMEPDDELQFKKIRVLQF